MTEPGVSDHDRRTDARRHFNTPPPHGHAHVLRCGDPAPRDRGGDRERGRERASTVRDGERRGRPRYVGALQPGTYPLPGLSAPVSITVPAGWSAGNSIWGPAGEGSRRSPAGDREPRSASRSSTSDAPSVLGVGGCPARSFGHSGLVPTVARGLHGARGASPARSGGRPPARLAGAAGPGMAADVHRPRAHRGGRRRDLRRPARRPGLLPVPRPGSLGVRGAGGWHDRLPTGCRVHVLGATAGEPGGDTIVLGVARELGAPPSTNEWDVVRTLEIG